MLERIPNNKELNSLMGSEKYVAWCNIRMLIESLYEFPTEWNFGGTAWTYEFKYRRCGKTLCALYAKKKNFGFLLIYGKEEMEKFETQREKFSKSVIRKYDKAIPYRGGKWIMLDGTDPLEDIKRLLIIKRRPNK